MCLYVCLCVFSESFCSLSLCLVCCMLFFFYIIISSFRSSSSGVLYSKKKKYHLQIARCRVGLLLSDDFSPLLLLLFLYFIFLFCSVCVVLFSLFTNCIGEYICTLIRFEFLWKNSLNCSVV